MTMREKLMQPWVIRKLVYGIMALVCAIGAAVGVITQAQADQLYAHADELINLLSMVVLMVAASKTGAHSDLNRGADSGEAPN